MNYYDPVSDVTGWRTDETVFISPSCVKRFQKIGDKSYYLIQLIPMKRADTHKGHGLEEAYYDPESGAQRQLANQKGKRIAFDEFCSLQVIDIDEGNIIILTQLIVI